MMRRDRPPTPGTVIRMAYDGFGVEDIHVRTGYAYDEIAGIIAARGRGKIWPLAKMAARYAIRRRAA